MTQPEAFTHLPIIDISPFLQEQRLKATNSPIPPELLQERQKVASQLNQACHEVGFLYLKGHGIEQRQMELVLEKAREFFSLPTEKKTQYPIDPDTLRGYQKLGENVTRYKRDWHEAIDCYRDETNPDHPLKGLNQWPDTPSDFRTIFAEYIDQLLVLGSIVMKIMAIGMGLPEEYFDRFIDKAFWGLRIIGYPPLDSVAVGDGISCGEHCDYGCVTFLNPDSTKGALQVKNTAGRWIQADPIPGAFIVNLGDMLKLWTNGYYQSTPHQVIHKGSNYRVSIPFFFEPNFDAVIEAVPPFRGSDSKQIIYGNHLLAKVRNNFAFQVLNESQQNN